MSFGDNKVEKLSTENSPEETGEKDFRERERSRSKYKEVPFVVNDKGSGADLPVEVFVFLNQNDSVGVVILERIVHE